MGESEDAWASLLPIGVLSIVTLCVTSIFLRARKELAVRFTVQVPPQLRSGWGRKNEPAEQSSHEDIIRNGRIYPQCPADGRPLGPPIDPATDSAVDSAISSATRAQLRWAQTSFPERRRVLRTLLRYILDHQDEIVAACCLDSGKTKIDACFGEILVTVEKLQWTIKHGEKALRPTRRPTNLLMHILLYRHCTRSAPGVWPQSGPGAEYHLLAGRCRPLDEPCWLEPYYLHRQQRGRT